MLFLYLCFLQQFVGYLSDLQVGTTLADTYVDSHVVIAYDKMGMKMCGRQCLYQKTCNAINYDRYSLTCELLNTETWNESLLQQNNTFSAISSWNMAIDACHPNPCTGKQRCVKTVSGGYYCIQIITPCDSINCQNEGSCKNGLTDFTCRCLPSYSGTYCEVSPCTDVVCQNSGTCAVNGDSFLCKCTDGYYGTYCESTPCTGITCQNSGTCTINGSEFTCNCITGYYGTYCEVTPCTNVACQNSGTCAVSGDSFVCNCQTGYFGTFCEVTPCTNVSCQNSGTCAVSGDSFVCNCHTGYYGPYCESPVTYKGTIQSKNYPKKYPLFHVQTWELDSGFLTHRVLLVFRAFDIEERYDNVTIYDGTQVTNLTEIVVRSGHFIPPSTLSSGQFLTVVFETDYSITYTGFLADCDEFQYTNIAAYDAPSSEQFLECLSDLQVGTTQTDTYVDSHVVIAYDKMGMKMCGRHCLYQKTCNAINYHSLTCELLNTETWNESLPQQNSTFSPISSWDMAIDACHPNPCTGKQRCVKTVSGRYYCIEIVTPCDTSNCQNGGSCKNGLTDFTCRCLPSYSGTYCEVSACTGVVCQNSGTCIASGDLFMCSCPPGYTGTYCETSPCAGIDCQNAGTCSTNGSEFTCNCATGYYGSYCEMTPCTDVSCQNSGTCVVSGASFVCNCMSGYSGTYCENTPCTNVTCFNGGNCTTSGSTFDCNCPSMTAGTKCEYLITHKGFIKSTNFPNNYPVSHTQQWELDAGAPTYRVLLVFRTFDLENYDGVTIYDGLLSVSPAGSITGTTIPDPLLSSGQFMSVRFQSDNVVTRPGFFADWYSIS